MYFQDIEEYERRNPTSPKIDPEIQTAFRALQQQSRNVWFLNSCTPRANSQTANSQTANSQTANSQNSTPNDSATQDTATQDSATQDSATQDSANKKLPARNTQAFGNDSNDKQTEELIEALRSFIDAYLASLTPYAGFKN
jgi:hypothetical protein